MEESSKLLNSLERILLWMSKYLPEYVKYFQTGLSQPEIQAAVEDIQYSLPNDFYELYQWHNGTLDECTQSLGPVFYFLPLNQVLEFKNWLSWDISKTDRVWVPPRYLGNPVLPFVKSNCEYYSLVLSRNYRDQAHIVLLDEVSDAILKYDSITSMMESIADCFETEAYYFNEEGFVEENEHLSAEVLRDRNPKVIAEAIDRLRRGIEICVFDQTLDQESYLSCDKSLMHALETLKPFRPPKAIQILQELLPQLEESKSSERDVYIYGIFHQWLGDVGAR
jgi:hypothetical protein